MKAPASAPSRKRGRKKLSRHQAAVMCARFRLDGLEDLPPQSSEIRLMESKARIVAAVVSGLVDEQDIFEVYALSPLEFRVWRRLVEQSSFVPA